MKRPGNVKRLTGVVMVAAVLAASCGGADDDGGEPEAAPDEVPDPEMVDTVPMDEWVDMTNDLCMETHEATASVPEPQSLDDVGPALSAAAQSAQQFTEDLIAVGTPDTDVDGVLTYINFSRKVADLLDRASVTAEDDPEAALTETEELEELGPASDLVAREIGITGCYEIEPVGEAELLDLSDYIAPVPPTPEEMQENLVEAGYTPAEAACLVERRDQLPEIGDEDFEEAMTKHLAECGIGIDRMTELFLESVGD